MNDALMMMLVVDGWTGIDVKLEYPPCCWSLLLLFSMNEVKKRFGCQSSALVVN